ncbi:Metal tolerance protein 10 [Linum perenne]
MSTPVRMVANRTPSPRIDSFDYRVELLSPPPPGERAAAAAESSLPSWRLDIDKFQLPSESDDNTTSTTISTSTPRRQSRRQSLSSSYCSIPSFLASLGKKERKVAQYYKAQQDLVKEFNEVDSFVELGVMPGELTDKEIKEVARGEKIAIYASNVANLVLFAAKVYASMESRSMAVIASTVDSFLDLMSGFILWFTDHAMRKPNQYRYPIGKQRMQPVGIVVFASVMATLGLQIIFESGRELLAKAKPESEPNKVDWMIGIMTSVTFIKLGLTLYCRGFKNEIVRAYAQDHFFDVITNSIGLAAAVLAIKFYWWIDPVGAILIALYTIWNWSGTVMENVGSLIGRTAPPEYLAKLIYLIWNHHQEIKHIDTVRAYTFGCNYFVEADIVLPADMSLCEAHNIGETLQEKIEQFPEVERAFVHVDFEFTHQPEHNPKRLSSK